MDTKDPTYEIPKELTYHEEIRKFQNDDLLHADNVVNPVIQQVVENTAYNKGKIDECKSELGTKVTKVNGKGLSTNDYTTAEKNKLTNLNNYDDTKIKNLVSSKADKSDLNSKQDRPITANTAYGIYTLKCNTSGKDNTAIGYGASQNNTSGGYNVSIGQRSLFSNTTGNNNTAIGVQALEACTTGSDNTGIGRQALSAAQDNSNHESFNNCTGIGANSRVSGDNQLQLGFVNTTTYAYGAVQNRSDARDKADIQDTELGLDFIKGIRPVGFRWDYRDDYFEEVKKDDGTTKLKKIPKDGTKKRKRLHQGFIAQEVKQVIDNLNVDFGGYQDHSINGGCDVLSLGYEEFIAPMVKAIQEQQKMIEELQKQVKLLGGKTNGTK